MSHLVSGISSIRLFCDHVNLLRGFHKSLSTSPAFILYSDRAFTRSSSEGSYPQFIERGGDDYDSKKLTFPLKPVSNLSSHLDGGLPVWISNRLIDSTP